MHAKYNISSSHGKIVKGKVKVDKRQTYRQDKINMPESFDPGTYM